MNTNNNKSRIPPRLLHEFKSHLQRPISPTIAAEQLKLSVSRLIKIANDLGVESVMKGSRSRWMIRHADIRRIHTYLVALDQGYTTQDAKEFANSISDIVQSIYDFPSNLEYEIEIDVDYLKGKLKLSREQIAEIKKKAKEANDTWRLLENFQVLIGIGGKISLFANYLKEEISSGEIIISVIPKFVGQTENVHERILRLKQKVNSLEHEKKVKA